MSSFEEFKHRLFPDQDSKNALISAVHAPDFDTAFETIFFQTKDENELQRVLAPLLRARTIQYMGQEPSPSQYVRAGKQAYDTLAEQRVFSRSYTENLDYQGRRGVWATEVEAGALADLLDITLVVTPIRLGVEQTSLSPRRAQDTEAPVVKIYNSNNIHWYFYENQYGGTIGDGNCLYNAFAQAIRQILLFERTKQESNTQKELLGKIDSQEITTLSAEALLNKVSVQVKSSEKKEQKQKEHPPKKMSGEEQQQIMAFLNKFQAQLEILRRKANELEAHSLKDTRYINPAIQATQLVEALDNAIDTYQNDHDKINFYSTCFEAINTSRAVLEEHRGWKEILYNIALAIVGCGLFYAAATLVNRGLNGHYFFRCSTDSSKKLDDLENSLQP